MLAGERMARIDHIIVKVNDLPASLAFYVEVMGFRDGGMDGPFAILFVDDDFVLQLAPYGTNGHEHYAFALGAEEFEACLARIKARGIPFGGTFDSVGSNVGPGRESGARGMAPTVYFFDPNRHLLEIRTYDVLRS